MLYVCIKLVIVELEASLWGRLKLCECV